MGIDGFAGALHFCSIQNYENCFMNRLPNRIVVYARDVMNITGRKERAAYKLLALIRKKYNKPKEAFISIDEFCAYTGLKEDKVEKFLV